jgi:hypothetical protein
MDVNKFMTSSFHIQYDRNKQLNQDWNWNLIVYKNNTHRCTRKQYTLRSVIQKVKLQNCTYLKPWTQLKIFGRKGVKNPPYKLI